MADAAVHANAGGAGTATSPLAPTPSPPPSISPSASLTTSGGGASRKKSFLGGLFSKKDADDTAADKDGAKHEAPAHGDSAPPRTSPAHPALPTPAVSPSDTLTLTPAASTTEHVTSLTSTTTTTTTSTSSSSSTTTTVSASITDTVTGKDGSRTSTARGSLFSALFHKKDSDAPATHSPTPPVIESPSPTSPAIAGGSSLLPPTADSRRRSMSDATSRDAPALTVNTMPVSRSHHADLGKLAAADGAHSPSHSPGASPSPQSGGPNISADRKRSFLSTLFTKKDSKDSADGADAGREEATANIAIAVDASSTAVAATSSSLATSVHRLQQRTESSESDVGRRRSLSDVSERSTPSESDSRRRAAGQSSHTRSQPARIGRTSPPQEKRPSVFATLLKKIGGGEGEDGDRAEAEADDSSDRSEDAPESAPQSGRGSVSSSVSAAGIPADGLDYKGKMAELLARRVGNDSSRRSSMSEANHAPSSSSSSASDRRATSSRSSAVSAAMSDNNTLAERNLGKLRQMESKAAEMEDAADSMLARARKIKEDAMKKSKWGW